LPLSFEPGILGVLLHQRGRCRPRRVDLGEHLLREGVGGGLVAGLGARVERALLAGGHVLPADQHVLHADGGGAGGAREDRGRLQRIGRRRRDALHDVVAEAGLDDADLLQLEAQRRGS
jgi:hypothetical protein